MGTVTAYDGFEPTWELQAQVNVDLQAISEYGECHAAEFGGLWLQDHHQYGVVFTGSVRQHRTELEALVGLPERLRVDRCSYSLADLRIAASAIVRTEMETRPRDAPPGGVVGVARDVQKNVVVVRLLPGHPEVEARLRTTYGPIVSVEPGAAMQAF